MTDNGTPEPAAPDTLVLVHGFWVTPLSWEEVADYALDWAEANASRPVA